MKNPYLLKIKAQTKSWLLRFANVPPGYWKDYFKRWFYSSPRYQY